MLELLELKEPELYLENIVKTELQNLRGNIGVSEYEPNFHTNFINWILAGHLKVLLTRNRVPNNVSIKRTLGGH